MAGAAAAAVRLTEVLPIASCLVFGAVYGAALGVFLVALLDAAAKRDVTIVEVVPELVEGEEEATTGPAPAPMA